jgi:hemoglobin/transferrin/lactoferrin receptor protein
MHKMNKNTLLISLICGINLPLTAIAEESGATNDAITLAGITQLSTVVVSGTRTQRQLMDVPVSMSVITEKEIKRSGAEQLGELLRDVPGVNITDTSVAGAKRVRIRGEVGSNVLILIDGQEISEQRSFHGAAPILVDMSIVKRVEVIKGPGSVLYGSKAIGGVVNFITRKGGERPLQAELNASYNSSTEGFNSSAQLYGSANNFDYRLSVTKSDHGDRKVPDGSSDNLAYSGKDGVLENSSFDNSSINGYLAYNTDNMTFGGRVESYKADTESHTDNSIIEEGLAGFQLDLPKRDRKKYSIFAEARNITDNLIKARVDAYHQVRDRDFFQDLLVNVPNFAGPGSNMSIDLDLATLFEQETSGIQGQVDWVPHKDHYIVAGFEYIEDKMDSNVTTQTRTVGTVPFPPFTLFDTTSLTDHFVKATQKTKALYIQDEWSFTDDMTLTAGVRQTWVESELENTNSPLLSQIETKESRPVGSLSLMYSGIDNMVLRTGWSQGFRVPSLLELLEGTPHGGSGVLYSNPDLDPETSNNYEIGLRLDDAALTLDAAIFYTRAKDYVATVNCASSATSCPVGFGARDTQYINLNGAKTYGLELFGAYTLSSLPLEIYSNLTYLKRKFEYRQFSTNETGLPNLEGRIGLRMETDKGNTNYWGDLYLRAAAGADVESPDSSSPTGKEKDHYSGWTTLNLSLGTEIGRQAPIRLSMHLNNLFDKTYTPAQESLIAPGRHFIINAGINF